ncbi:calcium/sodium antiporter [Patescibacteria group bacterium]|nr:calcium/sodium antiporter [Patescibacteria group bacterium]MBU1890150.1 calcium/sodium antiporter [Patescibacteria group bacterium]
MILVWLLLFVVSLIVIIKSADYFTDAAERLGELLGLSGFFIGVTIIALGTSLPELAISLLAISRNSGEIVIGNVVGSNIFNLLVIIGIAFVLTKKFVFKKLTSVILVLASTIFIVLTGLVFSSSEFSCIEGIVGLALFMVSLFYIQITREHHFLRDMFYFRKPPLFADYRGGHGRSIVTIIFSLILIYFGAWLTIQSMIEISSTLNVSKEFIAITATAIGTSLPELLVTLTAIKKKHYDMIVGNIAGSNMINAFLILGIPSLIKPLEIPFSIISVGLPFLLVSTLLFAIFGVLKHAKRWVGLVFLLLYVLFILVI